MITSDKRFDDQSRTSFIVWRAKDNGYKRFFGKTELSFSDGNLRIARKLKCALAHIDSVEELGAGFRITWKDPESGKVKQSAFCCPTIKGYSRGRRDQIVRNLRNRIAETREQIGTKP